MHFSNKLLLDFFFFIYTDNKEMSYGSTPYPHPPPAYDEEASQPLMGPGEDMYKETVSNSSLEIRLRKSSRSFFLMPSFSKLLFFI
jgi:hypothetical protein